MSEREVLFTVSLSKRNLLPRLLISLTLPALLTGVFAGQIHPYAASVMRILFMTALAWPLVLKSSHALEVREDVLVHIESLSNRRTEIPVSEIRSARFTGVWLLRYLILTDAGGNQLAALEADMDNMDALVQYLRGRNIPITNAKERN